MIEYLSNGLAGYGIIIVGVLCLAMIGAAFVFGYVMGLSQDEIDEI